jgi:hypothetical protein
MGFTTIGDIYEVAFRVSKKVGNAWKADPQSPGAQAKHYVVATSEQNAVSIVQGYMGADNVTTRVECHGAVRRVLQNVIIAV